MLNRFAGSLRKISFRTVDAGKMEILATLVAGIVDRRFKLECELYATFA